MIAQGDLFLVPFPFSNQSGKKVRPVVVISNNEYNKKSEDLIIVGVTSNLIHDNYTLSLSQNDLEEGNLITECIIKADNVLRLNKDLVIKKIGNLRKQKTKQIIDLFKSVLQ